MFNFRVMNRALNDSNLSDKAFRMLYTLVNYCSLKNADSVEIHNEYFMNVLNVCERQIQRVTNELVENGYITKEVQSTPKKRIPNKYTLLEVEVNDTPTDSLCTESSTQKFPLNNKVLKGDKNVTLKNNDDIKRHNKATLLGDKNVTPKNNNKINNINNNIVNDHTIVTVEKIEDKLTNNIPSLTSSKNTLVNIEVCDSSEQREEDKTNASLDELLNSDRVIITGDTVTNSYLPTTKTLLSPDIEDTTNDISSTDSTGINNRIELRSVTDETTSTLDPSLTSLDTSTQEELVINENTNNDKTIQSNTFINNTPQPPTPPRELMNDNETDDMTLEEYNKMQFMTPERCSNNEEFTDRIKMINEAIEAYKEKQDYERRSLVFAHCKICKWWYDEGKITQKQMEWVNKIQSNFEKIITGIYIKNKTKRNRAVLSHKNNKDKETINRNNKTQQEANKVAIMRSFNQEEQNTFEELIKTGGDDTNLKSVVDYIKCNYNGYPAIKLEKFKTYCDNSTFSAPSNELYKELKEYITQNIA